MANILVIDDEPNICMILRMAFGDEGHSVSTLTDSRRALEEIRRSPRPDLVIVDLFMPEVSGKEIVERLRSDSGWDNVPVIILTGAVPHPAILPPAGSYQALIGKPFDLFDLLDKVKGLLEAAPTLA
jgi:CheY-like chemotaxis protein